jgi:Spherulation-specific family 4
MLLPARVRGRRLLLLLSCALSASVAQLPPGFLGNLTQRLLVPSYFAPCEDPSDPPHGPGSCAWDEVVGATASHAFSAIGHVILNPLNGPGAACDAGYLNVSRRVRGADANMGILGYVYTGYAKRALTDVLADVDLYARCYAPPLITGIFVDEASSDCADLAYYEELAAHIRAAVGPGAPASDSAVVLNPGAPSSECYLAKAADVLVTFEGPVAQYAAFVPAAWHLNNSAARFAHIVYNATHREDEDDDLLLAMRLSKAHNAGRIFVTSANLPNPYGGLPEPYIMWDKELRWAVGII